MQNTENLAKLKYADLQKLAKKHGIKANIKAEKLIDALRNLYHSQSFVEQNSNESSEEIQLHTKESQKISKNNSPKNRGSSKLLKQSPGSGCTKSTPSLKKKGSFSKKKSIDFQPSNDSSLVCDVNDNASMEDKKQSSCSASKQIKNDVSGIIDSMKENMTDAEMKESMLNALNCRIKEDMAKQSSKDNSSNTQIPRFVKFLQKKEKETQKKDIPVTPGNKDWKRIHQKAFKKMDSIDVYLNKKRQRTYSARLNQDVKKRKLLADTPSPQATAKTPTIALRKCVETPNSRKRDSPKMSNRSVQKHITKRSSKRNVSNKSPPKNVTNRLSIKTPNFAKANKSPLPKSLNKSVERSKMPLKKSNTSPNKNTVPVTKVFVPSVTSTKDMVLNFDNGCKPTFSAKRKGIRKNTSKIPSKTFVPSVLSTSSINFNFGGNKDKSASATKTVFSAKRTTFPTPRLNSSSLKQQFESKKEMNSTLKGSATKFDLTASLSKPLSWKPHKGKLTPFKLENIYNKKTKVTVKSREERAKLTKVSQAAKRRNFALQNRGISS